MDTRSLTAVENDYVRQGLWVTATGRVDLVDVVADEFERRRPEPVAVEHPVAA